MDPALISSLISALLAAIPESYVLPVALAILACKLATVFWRPPAAASRWAVVYRIVSTIALNVGWAVSRFSPGVSSVPVALSDLPTAKALLDASPDVTRLHLPSVPLALPKPVLQLAPPSAGPGSTIPVPPAS